ncbi:MAG: heme-copper oxidase subunit III [Anaerolineae bacterium]|uniref:cytochrome c oxidase subunit 3 n=1 Tax=Candidatus Flexifilum breve TaxID=3140694 RepID=UPI001AC3A81B|nr:heme-copper oxidase subunit III [Chloroflexota bacterium]MBK9747188.1 heme-copper oxidase subunit III [Chloroflexota bacterium]MBN8637533.1 heme-copper oxidase subunit III [Anaerolineae bacterium]
MSEARIDTPQVHTHTQAEATHIDNMKFAMWLFLASEVVLFAVMIAGYVLFRVNFPERVKEVHEAAGILLVTLNTFLLLSSSWTMVMGLRAIQGNDQRGLIRWIGLTALLGTIFVILQGVEYTALSHEGITIYSDNFGMRFYAPTALHGAHVIIGVLWALWVLWRGSKGTYNSGKFLGVEIFGLYWHFVDVVWIFLFTLIYLI